MKKIILITAICALCTQAHSQWSLTGNAGTNSSTNFIGTTDAKAFNIRTNNAVRMSINTSGRVGIGTTSPLTKLHVSGTGALARFGTGTTATTTNYWFTGNDVGSYIEQHGNTTTAGSDRFRIQGSKSGLGVDYSQFFIDPVNGFMFLSIGAGNGNVGIGTVPAYKLSVVAAPNSLVPVAFIENTGGGDINHGLFIKAGANTTAGVGSSFIRFLRPDGTSMGSVTQGSASAIFYSTSSDKRLKNIIGASQKGLSDLMKINIYDYTFKSDPDKNVQTGFMAQELYEVFPQSVSKPRENNEPAEKNPWMVDYGSVTPLIIRSVQEQQKMIDELKKSNDELKKQNENLQSTGSNLQNENAAIKSRLNKLELAFSQCCVNYDPSNDNHKATSGSQQTDAAELEQNHPNPFTQQTEIKFHLPAKFNSAQLVITDERGKQIRTYTIQSSKPIMLKAGELSAGMYSYSLIIDGTIRDSKQMILTK